MATLAAYVHVGFKDAGFNIQERVFRLAQTAEDDGSDMADVLDAAAALETALDVLTMDHIEYVDVRLHRAGAGAAANIAANNTTRAFVRTVITSTGKPASFEVPAWDDVTYGQNNAGKISSAFEVLCGAVALLTVDPATGLAWTVDYAQNRDSKRWKPLE